MYLYQQFILFGGDMEHEVKIWAEVISSVLVVALMQHCCTLSGVAPCGIKILITHWVPFSVLDL